MNALANPQVFMRSLATRRQHLATSAVLANAFPSERQRLEAMAIEASLSRLYAGIHYRFDMEAGLALGRAAAALALQADLDQVAPLP